MSWPGFHGDSWGTISSPLSVLRYDESVFEINTFYKYVSCVAFDWCSWKSLIHCFVCFSLQRRHQEVFWLMRQQLEIPTKYSYLFSNPLYFCTRCKISICTDNCMLILDNVWISFQYSKCTYHDNKLLQLIYVSCDSWSSQCVCARICRSGRFSGFQ